MMANAPDELLAKEMVKPTIQKSGSVAENNGATYDFYRPRDTRTKWQRFKDDIYNPREGTFLGRNRNKWGVLGLFYLAFYTGLGILCSLCFMGLMYTIDENRPTYTLESSLIGTNPGMGFRPFDSDINDMSTIKYDSRNGSHIDKWVDSINEFLEKHIDKEKLPNGGRNQMICSYGNPPQPGKVCAVDVSSANLGPCAPGTKYGFDHASPCIFVKLNKIFDWVPEFHNDVKSLPDSMPDDLKNHIKSSPASDLNAIWVSCHGETKIDIENLGEIEYWPKSRSFPGYYYPFVNHPEYLSPVVAVHLLRPKRNTTIGIECRAWAKNINYSTHRGEKAGSVHFELHIVEQNEANLNKTM